jgi:hypothetical protein
MCSAYDYVQIQLTIRLVCYIFSQKRFIDFMHPVACTTTLDFLETFAQLRQHNGLTRIPLGSVCLLRIFAL